MNISCTRSNDGHGNLFLSIFLPSNSEEILEILVAFAYARIKLISYTSLQVL